MSELIIQDSGVHAKAELDVQITTAKAYPRKQKEFIEKAIELATLDQETAASCIYCLVRKGKEGKTEIKGGSIRLAEIVAACWGNIHAATRIIGNDGKMVTAQGVCWDIENNVKISTEVKRSIVGKFGAFSQDMQVVTGNAAAAIALRNAIFKVVPKALVDRVYDAAVKFAVGDQKTIDSRRKAIFERFNKIGIENQKIFSFYNKEKMEDFDSNDLVELIGIGTSIKEGSLSVDKAFSLEVAEDHNTEDKLNKLLDNES